MLLGASRVVNTLAIAVLLFEIIVGGEVPALWASLPICMIVMRQLFTGSKSVWPFVYQAVLVTAMFITHPELWLSCGLVFLSAVFIWQMLLWRRYPVAYWARSAKLFCQFSLITYVTSGIVIAFIQLDHWQWWLCLLAFVYHLLIILRNKDYATWVLFLPIWAAQINLGYYIYSKVGWEYAMICLITCFCFAYIIFCDVMRDWSRSLDLQDGPKRRP